MVIPEGAEKDFFQLILLSVALSTLLVLLFIIFVLYYQKKLLKKKQEQESLEYQLRQKMLSLSIAGQEKERLRISQELHDGIGANLASVRLILESVPLMEGVAARSELSAKALKLLKTTIGEIRYLSHNLTPVSIKRFGLVSALESYAANLSNSRQICVNFTADDSPTDLSPEEELAYYRIVQELVANAIKHGQASSFRIRTYTKQDQFVIELQDDGQNFNFANASKKLSESSGIGLMSIVSRLSILNAELEQKPKECGNKYIISKSAQYSYSR